MKSTEPDRPAAPAPEPQPSRTAAPDPTPAPQPTGTPAPPPVEEEEPGGIELPILGDLLPLPILSGLTSPDSGAAPVAGTAAPSLLTSVLFGPPAQ